jgi:hypothetical protein
MLQTFIFFRVWECNKEPQFFDFLGLFFSGFFGLAIHFSITFTANHSGILS